MPPPLSPQAAKALVRAVQMAFPFLRAMKGSTATETREALEALGVLKGLSRPLPRAAELVKKEMALRPPSETLPSGVTMHRAGPDPARPTGFGVEWSPPGGEHYEALLHRLAEMPERAMLVGSLRGERGVPMRAERRRALRDVAPPAAPARAKAADEFVDFLRRWGIDKLLFETVPQETAHTGRPALYSKWLGRPVEELERGTHGQSGFYGLRLDPTQQAFPFARPPLRDVRRRERQRVAPRRPTRAPVRPFSPFEEYSAETTY